MLVKIRVLKFSRIVDFYENCDNVKRLILLLLQFMIEVIASAIPILGVQQFDRIYIGSIDLISRNLV